MTLISFAGTLRAAWDELFKREPKVDYYLIHLEREIMQLQADKERLEGKCDMLQLKLDMALAPKVVEVPQKKVLPKFNPLAMEQESSWEAIQRRQREENERLDKEDREAAAKAAA